MNAPELTGDEKHDLYLAIDYTQHDERDLYEAVEKLIAVRLGLLTSEPALAAFRDAWQQADAEGATGDRVRRGMVAAIEAVS